MVAHLCLAQEAHFGQAHPMTLIAKGNVIAYVRMQGEWGYLEHIPASCEVSLPAFICRMRPGLE